MPNVVIVNAVYPPEPVVSAQIGSDLALYLAKSGTQVIVLCPFPTRPAGAKYPGYLDTKHLRLELQEGVKIVRLPSYTSPEFGLFGRMRENISFGLHVGRYLLKNVEDIAVLYVNAWPLFCQAIVGWVSLRRHIPMVLHIQDLYPESLIAKLGRPWRLILESPLKSLDRWTAGHVKLVVTISEGMRQIYIENRGLSPDRVVTIPNWTDISRFEPAPPKAVACERYGISRDKFTFLFLGNIGPVAGVEGLIKAFHAARLNCAQLVIAGDGSAKNACKDLVRQLGTISVHFISDPNVTNVPLLQSLADVCLLSMRKHAGTSSIPSKLMAYCLSSKPVLATVDAESDTARCIRSARCGWVGDPEDIGWLTSKLCEVASLPQDVLQRIGAKGREYGLLHFAKNRGVEHLANVLTKAIDP